MTHLSTSNSLRGGVYKYPRKKWQHQEDNSIRRIMENMETFLVDTSPTSSSTLIYFAPDLARTLFPSMKRVAPQWVEGLRGRTWGSGWQQLTAAETLTIITSHANQYRRHKRNSSIEHEVEMDLVHDSTLIAINVRASGLMPSFFLASRLVATLALWGDLYTFSSLSSFLDSGRLRLLLSDLHESGLAPRHFNSGST